MKKGKSKKKVKKLPALDDKEPKAKPMKKPEANPKDYPTLQLKTEHDIAMDFAVKVYKKFDKTIKSIVLFGSQVKQNQIMGSDIDIVIIIDDVSIKWDQELIAWYREELDNIIRASPYKSDLHINTVKISTWWEDLMRGDPVVINVIRNGEALIDFAGFFEPLKYLLEAGKIKPSPEAIYVSLQRAPMNFARSKAAELTAIEGLFWAMVDSAHAVLIALNILPPSPEHLAVDLREHLVDKGKLKMKYVQDYRDLLMLHKKIAHGQISDLPGKDIDEWQEKTKEFMEVMNHLVHETVEKN
ncbi:nucleotidyltransferase domain-containing protein [Candidatus Pacearchaeota archaeon]|nr:nucleotidyltransferase domain-containing protein [Candidatus Pacearchaeota archaeon]